MFSEAQASRATRDLETLGVQVWASCKVTNIDADGVSAGDERIRAATVLWAAGVEASTIGRQVSADIDRQGRVIVEADLSVKQHPNVFVIGDMAHCRTINRKAPAGYGACRDAAGPVSSAALFCEIYRAKTRQPFHFVDKGQMATIGRSRAILDVGRLHLAGFPAWVLWLLIHIYYLTGFKNRVLVVAQWAWSYLTFGRGARLIVNKEWRFGKSTESTDSPK